MTSEGTLVNFDRRAVAGSALTMRIWLEVELDLSAVLGDWGQSMPDQAVERWVDYLKSTDAKNGCWTNDEVSIRWYVNGDGVFRGRSVLR